jgi:hypothetical protein
MRNEIAMVDQLAILRTLAYVAIAVPSQRCRRSNGEMSATSLRLTCDHRKPIADRSQRNRDCGSPLYVCLIGTQLELIIQFQFQFILVKSIHDYYRKGWVDSDAIIIIHSKDWILNLGITTGISTWT